LWVPRTSVPFHELRLDDRGLSGVVFAVDEGNTGLDGKDNFLLIEVDVYGHFDFESLDAVMQSALWVAGINRARAYYGTEAIRGHRNSRNAGIVAELDREGSNSPRIAYLRKDLLVLLTFLNLLKPGRHVFAPFA
jgi:hypothetical protein